MILQSSTPQKIVQWNQLSPREKSFIFGAKKFHLDWNISDVGSQVFENHNEVSQSLSQKRHKSGGEEGWKSKTKVSKKVKSINKPLGSVSRMLVAEACHPSGTDILLPMVGLECCLVIYYNQCNLLHSEYTCWCNAALRGATSGGRHTQILYLKVI